MAPHTLVITNDFPPRTGGIELFAHELVKRFDPETVTVLTSAEPGSLSFDAAAPYEIIRQSTRTLLPTPGTTRQAADLARSVGADSVWFASSAPLALMARSLRRQASGIDKMVGTSHGHEVGWARLPGSRQALHQIGDSLDTLTYVTQYTRQAIAAALSPAARRRMVELSPGVNPEDFDTTADPATRPDPARARTAFDLGRGPVVLSVSRLVPRKGQDRLIQAWPAVVAAQPQARLIIVGPGPYTPKLQAMTAASPVAESITLAGRQTGLDLADLYAAASVFAMPCRTRRGGLEVEAFGIVFLEAQATGVPVIAGDSGGACEALRPGETGLVVDGASPDQIAAATLELLADPSRAAAMGATGRDWVRAHWTWQQRYEILTKLLGRTT